MLGSFHTPVKRYPTTVTLVADPDNKTKMMFCMNCQAPFTQYTGEIISIEPGVPPVEPYTITRCKNPRCNMMYSIMAIVTMSRHYYV